MRGRLIQWNAEGLAANGPVQILHNLIRLHAPDYLCLQETWAMPDSLTVGPEYKTFFSSRDDSRGAALLIRTALKPRFLTTISTPGGLAILATVPGGIVGSVYAPPRATAAELAAFITRLLKYNGAMLLAGDWNSRSTYWGEKSGRAQARGNCLTTRRRLHTHAPLEHSFTGSRGTSTVDLVVTAGQVTVIGVPKLVFPGKPSVYGHQPLLTPVEWRAPRNPDRRIRPSRLADQKIQESASAFYSDSLPEIADALGLVANVADLDLWYAVLTNTLKMPFQEAAGAKPRRSRPGWTAQLDLLRRTVRTLYNKGYRTHSQALSRRVQREYRKNVRARRLRLAQELAGESSPHRAAALRVALGISPKKNVAPEVVRRKFSNQVCERIEDRLPAPTAAQFQVTPSFRQSIVAGLKNAKIGRAPGPDGVYGEMIREAVPWLMYLLPDLWQKCGRLKTLPTQWRTQATEPAYKAGPTDDPASYRPIGMISVLRGVIDYAFRREMEKCYTPHAAQHGFRRGVSVEHAVLRVLRATRSADGPLALLDLKQAYPSVPRQELIQLVRDRVNPTLADMLTVLLAPTIVETIGDPGLATATTYRGLTQGDLKATTLFNLYIDPLLEKLDPDETMSSTIAFADDVTLVPYDNVHLQRQLRICENWSWSARMTWSLTKSLIVTPEEQNLEVRMCSVVLPTARKGRLLGVQVTAGRNAEALPETSIVRITHTIEALHRWSKAIKLHQRHPNYAWRRAMLHKFIRPIAEFGLPLVTMTLELRGCIARYDKHAADFVLGHRTRMSTSRVQAVFRLQGGELRRRWLATMLGTRIRNDLIMAWSSGDKANTLVPEMRAGDYRAHRPVVDAVIMELAHGLPAQVIWRKMLDSPSNRMTRKIPPTILASTHGQALLPPMLQSHKETTGTRAAFLAAQYYLNHFPQGLSRARSRLGAADAEYKLSRLKLLLSEEKLQADGRCEARDILIKLSECERPDEAESGKR